jgi:hypothetical protein
MRALRQRIVGISDVGERANRLDVRRAVLVEQCPIHFVVLLLGRFLSSGVRARAACDM